MTRPGFATVGRRYPACDPGAHRPLDRGMSINGYLSGKSRGGPHLTCLELRAPTARRPRAARGARSGTAIPSCRPVAHQPAGWRRDRHRWTAPVGSPDHQRVGPGSPYKRPATVVLVEVAGIDGPRRLWGPRVAEHALAPRRGSCRRRSGRAITSLAGAAPVRRPADRDDRDRGDQLRSAGRALRPRPPCRKEVVMSLSVGPARRMAETCPTRWRWRRSDSPPRSGPR